MEELILELSGKAVFFRRLDTNERETVLLLHGMRFSSENWVEIGALRKINQWGFNVVALDYPGFGKSEENEMYSLSRDGYAAASAFVSDFCSSVGLERVIMVGPSMGGGITIKSLIDHPELVSEVIVIAPAGFDELRTELFKIDHPVHIIWGSEDNTIDISYGRRYHDLIAGSTIHIIKGADHVPYLGKTTQFFSLIKKLLLHE